MMYQVDIWIYGEKSGLEVSICETSDYRNNWCCGCNEIVHGMNIFGRRRLQTVFRNFNM